MNVDLYSSETSVIVNLNESIFFIALSPVSSVPSQHHRGHLPVHIEMSDAKVKSLFCVFQNSA